MGAHRLIKNRRVSGRGEKKTAVLDELGETTGWHATMRGRRYAMRLNGHIKIENPHLLTVTDPATLWAELATVRAHYRLFLLEVRAW